MPSLFELQLKRNTRSNVGQAPEFLTDTATVSIVDCRLSIDMIFTDCRLTPEHRSLSTLTWSFWANIARHASSDIASPLSLCQQPADRTSWSRSAMAAWLGGILRQTNAHKHNLVKTLLEQYLPLVKLQLWAPSWQFTTGDRVEAPHTRICWCHQVGRVPRGSTGVTKPAAHFH